MNRLRAICLLVVYVLGATGAHELLKLPALFSHYALHLEERGNQESFFDFLAEHYTHQGDHDTEHSDHHKLPFKAWDNCSRVNQPFMPTLEVVVQLPVLHMLEPVQAGYRDDRFGQGNPTDIFQPPRC